MFEGNNSGFQGLAGERGFKGDGGMKGECKFLNDQQKSNCITLNAFSWHPWPKRTSWTFRVGRQARKARLWWPSGSTRSCWWTWSKWRKRITWSWWPWRTQRWDKIFNLNITTIEFVKCDIGHAGDKGPVGAQGLKGGTGDAGRPGAPGPQVYLKWVIYILYHAS